MAGLFITGGTGFLGRSLLPALALDRTRTVFVLSRDKNRALENLPAAPNLQVLEADLAGMVPVEEIRRLKRLDEDAWSRGERLLHVPTYFAWGRV